MLPDYTASKLRESGAAGATAMVGMCSAIGMMAEVFKDLSALCDEIK